MIGVRVAILVLGVALTAFTAPAAAQYGPTEEDARRRPAVNSSVLRLPDLPATLLNSEGDFNPVSVLAGAAELLPAGAGGGGASRDRSGGMSAAMNIMVLLTVITLVPSILLMTTCFVRIVIVLALLRQAIGTQSLPPPQVTLALALFMTLLVMSPTVKRINDEAIAPYRAGVIADNGELWDAAKQPVRDFMFAQIEATGNWSSLLMVLNYRGVDTSRPETLTRADVDMVSLIPAFMLSELKTAFLMGFRVYLPFLVIDMVISTMLISMSMMMLPPVLISLPFKLLLFVLVDGWTLIVGSLMHSFVQPVVAVLPAAG
ncbi:MAG: flagellar type III secretion system pore protein FliP [Phycisphaerales bacterium]